MEFEWDDAKSERCLPRSRLYGRVEGRLFVIVYTDHQSIIRIIWARPLANARERKRHGEGTPGA